MHICTYTYKIKKFIAFTDRHPGHWLSIAPTRPRTLLPSSPALATPRIMSLRRDGSKLKTRITTTTARKKRKVYNTSLNALVEGTRPAGTL